jgi:hypothetical protein
LFLGSALTTLLSGLVLPALLLATLLLATLVLLAALLLVLLVWIVHGHFPSSFIVDFLVEINRRSSIFVPCVI